MELLGDVAEVSTVHGMPDLAAIRRNLATARPDIPTGSDTMRTAVLLLAGPGLNFNIDRLAGRTRFPRGFVAACTRRLFDNGIWEHSGPVCTWKTPADDAFWRDVAVGVGRMHRRRDSQGRIEWADAGVWKKEYVLAKAVIAPLAISYACDSDRPMVTPSAEEKIERLPVQRKSIFAKPSLATTARVRRAIAPLGLKTEELVLTSSTVESEAKMDLFPEATWL